MRKIEFVQEFRASAARLNGFAEAGAWMRLAEGLEADGVILTATQAARWADAGFLAGEAASLILDGVTPETAAELDQVATEAAGGPERRAMDRIDSLVRNGVLVDPARVRQEQDPDDPDRIIVHIE